MQMEQWNQSEWYEAWVELARGTGTGGGSHENLDPSNPVHVPEEWLLNLCEESVSG